jgi:adenylate kinase (isozyme 1 subfamily)
VLGGPGSGKGTQCAKIVEKYGYQHLSAGDLLRDEVKSGSEVGKQCEQIMKEGKLVPQEVIIGLLKAAMIKSGTTDFLIDGFPRALDQAHMFESMIKPCEYVIFFDCPEEVMESRLLKRGETSGRSDDNAETIRKRFKTFVEQSLPVIEHYEKLSKAYKISATQDPDEVFAEVVKALEA